MLKVVSKKLNVSRRKVSKQWSKYRTVKKRILARKRLSLEEKKQILTSERDLARQKISQDWLGYREFKYGYIHKSPYSGFIFSKTLKQPNSIQKFYKAKKGFNTNTLDNIVPEILDQKGVTGVLVVFQVESEETGQKNYVSNYITKGVMKRIDGSIFEYVAERLRAGNTKDYKLKFIYLRVIYEKSKM